MNENEIYDDEIAEIEVEETYEEDCGPSGLLIAGVFAAGAAVATGAIFGAKKLIGKIKNSKKEKLNSADAMTSDCIEVEEVEIIEED